MSQAARAALDTAPAHRQTRVETLRELVDLAWPVMLSRIGVMVMGVTDAVVVGHLAARELGYHSVGWAPTNVVMTTTIGLLVGVQVMTARHVGEGRVEALGGVLRRGLAYALWLGVAATLLTVVGGPALLRTMGLEPDLARGAGRAMVVFALSTTTWLLVCALSFFLEALSRPKIGMVGTWAANLVNLGLALWLAPGHSGLPVYGAVATGWATFVARLALLAFLAVYVLRMPEVRAMGLFRPPIDGRAAAREQVRIGLGAGASYFIEVGAFAAMTLIAGRLGGVEAAAWAVTFNVAALVFMAPLGLATATAVLAGRAFGAKDPVGVRHAAHAGLGATTAITTVIGLVCAAFPEPIVRTFSDDAALVGMATHAVRLCALFFILDGLQVVAAQALRATGDVVIPTAFHLFSYGLVMLPLGWLFAEGLHWGINGMVYAVIVASLVSGGLLVARLLIRSGRAARNG